MDVWTLFPTADYTFLELDSSSGGFKVVSETAATGIVKDRDGSVQSGNAEAHQARTTLHIRPDEPFLAAIGGHQKLVGHGVRIGGVEYRIGGMTPGRDFEESSDAFYLCTLERSNTWVSALPLT